MTWQTKKLGDVLERNGAIPAKIKRDEYQGSGKYPVVDQGENLIAGFIDDERKLYQGDLPVVIFGDHTRVLKYVDFPFAFGADGIKILKPKGFLSAKFFYYEILLKPVQNLGYKRHFSLLKNQNIPLPPLKIQKQIVERLDKIVAAQKLNDELIQKTDELFQSLLHKELNPAGKDWDVKKLGEIAETSSGGTPLKEMAEFYENGTIPWLRSGEVSQGLIYKSELFINEKGLENSSAKTFPIDTVLVAMYGATAGQVGLLKFAASTNQAICGILPNDKFVPEYLYYFLKTQTNRLIQISTGGAQPNISQQIIRNIKVPLPDLKIQKQIAAKLSAVQNYKTQLLAQKSKLKELFDSALSKSMNG